MGCGHISLCSQLLLKYTEVEKQQKKNEEVVGMLIMSGGHEVGVG